MRNLVFVLSALVCSVSVADQLPAGCETFYKAVDACSSDFVVSAEAWGAQSRSDAETIVRQYATQRQTLNRIRQTDPAAVDRLCRAPDRRKAYLMRLDRMYTMVHNNVGANTKCRAAYNKAVALYDAAQLAQQGH